MCASNRRAPGEYLQQPCCSTQWRTALNAKALLCLTGLPGPIQAIGRAVKVL
ncbi:hypothetical protein [Pseudomonas trivialis]|uniref:hypothetical protein n=1 Tax=Pseudomonas trivialis TaxID=200450 RepID=UPI000B2E0309|nr:hypothetical protein [Pseudomonas trivialis]